MVNYVYKTRRVRRVGFQKPTNVVLVLIGINLVIFILELFSSQKIIQYFGLVPSSITNKLYLWQFITYMFLHGNIWHLFFNMFALFIFGNELQKLWGEKKFLTYYFLTGIGAGLCAYVLTDVPTIGASGAIYGLLLAYGITFPNRWLLFLFFLPIKAKYMVIIFGAIELLSSIQGYSDGIAHIAHLGGMAFGALYLWINSRIRKYRNPPYKTIDVDFTVIPPKNDNNVDELLDKILKYGIDSLTTAEKKQLIKAGKFFSRFYETGKQKENSK